MANRLERFREQELCPLAYRNRGTRVGRALSLEAASARRHEVTTKLEMAASHASLTAEKCRARGGNVSRS